MISISQALDAVIQRRPYLTELLDAGLINIMQLARQLQGELERESHKEMTVEAIAMAIRRRPRSVGTSSLSTIFQRPPNITLRSDLVEYTFANSPTLISKQALLMTSIQTGYDCFFAITQGVYETSCVTSSHNRERLQHETKGEKIIAQIHDLTALTVRLPPENVEMPGVYHHILSGLAQGGVNVIDVVSTNMELTVIVRTRAADAAFRILKDLFVS